MTVEPNAIQSCERQLDHKRRTLAAIEYRATIAPEDELPALRIIWRGANDDRKALEAYLKGLTNDQHPS